MANTRKSVCRRSERSRHPPKTYDFSTNGKLILRINRDDNKYTSEVHESLRIKISRKKMNTHEEKTVKTSQRKNQKLTTKSKDSFKSSNKLDVQQKENKSRRKSKIIISEDEDDDSDYEVKPKTRKSNHVSKSKKQKDKSLNKSEIKTKRVNKNKSFKENTIETALKRLHSSSVPDSLPCRESQFQDIYNFVEQKLIEGDGGCMYISGVPGTGKTATLYEVRRKLEEDLYLPSFKFIEINGLRLGEPNQFNTHFLMELTGIKRTNYQATDILNERFSNGNANKDFVILLVDELDFLRTKKQDILYHLFDWPNKKNSKLIVLAIANAMDLPERLLLNRVSSRLGLTRLSFQPYNFKELEQIIRARLYDINNSDVFEPDALQLICRKVSAVSGDARRALDICRRAVEITISDERQKVTMSDVDKALQEIFNSIKISRIRFASIQEQIFLRCLIQDFRMSGLEETRFLDIYNSHVEVCRFEGQTVPTTTELTKVATNLDFSKIILFEKSPSHLYRRIRLNISSDDIIFALNLDD